MIVELNAPELKATQSYLRWIPSRVSSGSLLVVQVWYSHEPGTACTEKTRPVLAKKQPVGHIVANCTSSVQLAVHELPPKVED